MDNQIDRVVEAADAVVLCCLRGDGNDAELFRKLESALADWRNRRAALPEAGGGHACDFCGNDYTDVKFCCAKRRDYLALHGITEHPTPAAPEAEALPDSVIDAACLAHDPMFASVGNDTREDMRAAMRRAAAALLRQIGQGGEPYGWLEPETGNFVDHATKGEMPHDAATFTLAVFTRPAPVADLKGRTVSVDVSTGDADFDHRIFATVIGEQDETILAEEASRNFAAPVAVTGEMVKAMVETFWADMPDDEKDAVWLAWAEGEMRAALEAALGVRQ